MGERGGWGRGRRPALCPASLLHRPSRFSGLRTLREGRAGMRGQRWPDRQGLPVPSLYSVAPGERAGAGRTLRVLADACAPEGSRASGQGPGSPASLQATENRSAEESKHTKRTPGLLSCPVRERVHMSVHVCCMHVVICVSVHVCVCVHTECGVMCIVCAGVCSRVCALHVRCDAYPCVHTRACFV